MQRDLVIIVVVAVAAGALFAWLWRGGYLERLRTYIRGTREELKKCSWPSWEELKGSTTIVAICIFILGGFTVAVDQILFRLFVLFKI
jgi:preprotein translocase subunit SecE